MKIIIVRHGDPDYEKDSLTELGWKEAEALSERMKNIKADECYVSPLGRAKDTASLSLEKMNMEAVELEWLREFAPVVKRPEKTGVAWDWLPKDWTNMPYAFDFDKWTDYPALKDAGVREEVDWIYSEFDKFLEKHGYKKEGKLFKVLNPNSDVIVFFCHFGLECILLSYLLNLQPCQYFLQKYLTYLQKYFLSHNFDSNTFLFLCILLFAFKLKLFSKKNIFIHIKFLK